MYNQSMGKSVPNAFTLIELLVVIAVMAVIGVYALSNYRSFGEDRNLKSAVLDVVSLLRTAQANATANIICNTAHSASWQVAFFADKKTINLNCLESAVSFTKKQLILGTNISVDSASGTSCPTGVPFTTNFTLLNGAANVLDNDNCILFTITLSNTKNTKSLIIEKGGRIYGQ